MLTGELVDHVADLKGFARAVTIKLEIQRRCSPAKVTSQLRTVTYLSTQAPGGV